MSKSCPSCGARVPEQFKFCGFCGSAIEKTARLPRPSSKPVDERAARRPVTILFADLTNSTTIAERSDPENVYILLRGMLEKLSAPVKRFGGRIDRYVGDGIMATFGVLEAHEDDPTRAILAALEMQQIMETLSVQALEMGGWEVRLRIGISTGEVVVGRVDTGEGLDISVYGHQVNLGERLRTAARKGTILVSESIYQSTRARFEFLPPVTLTLKGIEKTVIGYELIGERADPQPIRGLSGRRAPNVGRNREYETLVRAIQKMRIDGQGVIAMVSGEAGIGKSRLVDEVVNPLAGQFTILRTSATPHNRSSYALLIGLLEDLAEIKPFDAAETRREKTLQMLIASGFSGSEIEKDLVDLIEGQGSARIASHDPEILQKRLFAAIRRLFVWLARRRAVLMVLDDIQWSDASSLQALDQLSDLFFELPLALISITRESNLPEWPDFLQRARKDPDVHFLDIHLRPLSAEDSDKLVRFLLPEVSVSVEARASIYQRTSGNPLLIEELIRMLLDMGVVRESKSGWYMSPGWNEVIQEVPETIAGLMLARYDRQPPALRKILDNASILGTSFSLNLLSAVVDEDLPELKNRLGQLERADFLRRAGGPGESRQYFFRHALMQEAIRNTILSDQRKRLHLKAAQAIRGSDASYVPHDASVIAYHLEAAGSPEAVQFLFQAGTQAQERFANPDALDYFQRVRQLIRKDQADRTIAVDVALRIGEICYRMGRTEDAMLELNRAKALSLRLTQTNYRVVEILYHLGLVFAEIGRYAESISSFRTAHQSLVEGQAQERSIRETDIERELGWVMCYQGNLSAGKSHAEKALQLAGQSDDLAAAGSAYNLLAAVNYWIGDLRESVTSAQKALGIRERIGDVWGAASSQNSLGTLYHKLGQWSEAEALLRQAIFVQQEIGDYQTLPLTWSNLAMLLMDSGRLQEALHSADQSIESLQNSEDMSGTSIICHLNRGMIRLRMGMQSLATSDFEIAREGARRADHDDLHALAWIYKAEAQILQNNLSGASSDIEQAEQLKQDETPPEIQAEYLRVKAKILASKNEIDQALQTNRASRQLYQEMGSEYAVAKCKIEAAEGLLLKRAVVNGQIEDALQLTQEALQTFRRFHNQRDVLKAENLLFQLKSLSGAQVSTEIPMLCALAHLNLRSNYQSDQQEQFVAAVLQIAEVFQQVARGYYARFLSLKEGFGFVFLSSNLNDRAEFLTNVVRCAQDAVDEILRINNVRKIENSFEIECGVGIVSGTSHARMDSTESLLMFVGSSQIGKRAEAAARSATDFQILITPEIAQAIHASFDLEWVQRSEDAAAAGPLYGVLRAKPDHALEYLLPGSSDQLIGRRRERNRLRSWTEGMISSLVGGICYLEAQAGMGKSRLLEEVLQFARSEVHCFFGKCESFRTNISYSAFVHMLDQIADENSKSVHRLRGLLGIQPPDDRDEIVLQNLEPDDFRQELNGRFREFILQYAEKKPVLLIVEDIHWLDLSSLDLLDFLLPLTQQTAFSILLVARSEMPGPHRAIVSKAERIYPDRFLEITFGPLELVEQASLIQALLETDDVPAGLLDVLRPFAGHPLSTEEALRYLIESQQLGKRNGIWHYQPIDQAGSEALPGNFTDLLFKRLAFLENETLHILQAAAVLGETFDRKVLSQMIPGEDLMGRLSELEERKWLIPERAERSFAYRFRHTLTRETIYSTLFRSKRQLLHQRAGEALEQLYPEAQEANAEIVAHHFAESGLREKSLHYLLRAAEKSARRSALAESLSYFQRFEDAIQAGHIAHPALFIRFALGMADVHISRGEPSSALHKLRWLEDGQVVEPSAPLQVTRLRRQAEAYHKMGQFERALDHYQQSLELLEMIAVEEHSGSAWIALDQEAQRLQFGIAQTYFDSRENQLAQEHAQLALQLIGASHDSQIAAQVNNLLAGIAFRSGEYQEAGELVSKCIAIYQKIGNRVGVGVAYSNLGLLAAARQDQNAAQNYYALSLSIHESLGNASGITITRNNLGILEKNRGRYVAAIDHFEMAAETARPAELNQLLAQALSNLGQMLTFTMRTKDAMTVFSEVESLAENYHYRNLLCEVRWKWAECYLESGQLSAAQETAESALELAEEINSKDLQSEAERILARTFRRRGDAKSALELAESAWKRRETARSKLDRARFAAEYMLALKANGEWEQAKEVYIKHVRNVVLPEPKSLNHEVEAFDAEPLQLGD